MKIAKYPDINCIVLVGGKSVRLGRDKIVEPLGSNSILEWVLSRLSIFKTDIIIVGNAECNYYQLGRYPRVRFVADIFPRLGPLGGIYTGLATSTQSVNLVIAGDMPFLNIDLLKYMIKLMGTFDLVVPQLDGLIEPLHALYSKNCLVPIKELITKNELQIRKLYTLVKTRYVDGHEIERFDPNHLSFFNINNETDLTRAKELVVTEKQLNYVRQ